MFLRNALSPRNTVTPTWTRPELVSMGSVTKSGQKVTVESSKTIATAYRAGNIISDDVGKLPFQALIRRQTGKIDQMAPDWLMRNIAYLMSIKPNRWMNPFIFKKTVTLWLLHWGNAYVWAPPVRERELFIIPANSTWPIFDENGGLWYKVTFLNGETKFLPDVEMMHLMINSTDGINGRSVITYARETMGRQQGAHDTMGGFYQKGMNASAVMQMTGDLNADARKKIKEEYTASIGGSENAYGLAVIDQKVAQFTPITMKAIDMQFLESIAATDVDLANFYGMPLHMLNMGKQAYNSNDQKFLEYLSVTLDPYLVQWEDEARTKWVAAAEQPYTYCKFVREALLRTDPKTRASMNEVLIRSGQRSPDEAREKDDFSSYPGGNKFYMNSGVKEVGGTDATQQA